jgi:chorismate mutase / prephenate dehydratase
MWRPSGAKSCRPAWHWKRPSASRCSVPQGTFCEQAAIEFFGSAANLIYCANFDEVFHATAAGTAQYGVVGMENSTEGVVARSLDLFLRSPVHVVGEVSLLFATTCCAKLNRLRHRRGDGPPAGLGAVPELAEPAPAPGRAPCGVQQCRGRTPGRHQPDLGGPGQRTRGSQFGLHIVHHAIQDEAYNRTRFAVICLPQTLATPPASGKDCTSLVVSVPNRLAPCTTCWCR